MPSTVKNTQEELEDPLAKALANYQKAVEADSLADRIDANLDAPISESGGTSDRAMELLYLLQDKPIPEVVDPLNLQSALSNQYTTDGDGDYIIGENRTDRGEDDDYEDTTEKRGLVINPNRDISTIEVVFSIYTDTAGATFGIYVSDSGGTTIASTTADTNSNLVMDVSLTAGNDYYLEVDGQGDTYQSGYLSSPSFPYTGTDIDIVDGAIGTSTSAIVYNIGGIITHPLSCSVTGNFAAPTTAPTDFKQWHAIQSQDVTTGGSTSTNPVEVEILDSTGKILNTIGVSLPNGESTTTDITEKRGVVINPNEPLSEVGAAVAPETDGLTTLYVRETDEVGTTLGSATIENGRAVVTGLSLSAGTDYLVQADAGGNSYTQAYESGNYPYNGGKLDVISGSLGTSTDQNVFNLEQVAAGGPYPSIPMARIYDEPFVMRGRTYTEDDASNGQSTYTIPTTGDGGHFGIDILTVVSVLKNGSVIDSANWSYDDVDTVTIDTSAVTINSGDTIDIKYDFDVFDSTLQPRAFLNRESGDETSPSISHFRYEYVI